MFLGGNIYSEENFGDKSTMSSARRQKKSALTSLRGAVSRAIAEEDPAAVDDQLNEMKGALKP